MIFKNRREMEGDDVMAPGAKVDPVENKTENDQ